MRLSEVARRLDPLPATLPPPDPAIEPRLLLRPGANRLPDWAGPRSRPSEREAAALVLLFPDEHGETRVLLTERTSELRHGGQVSLPGGRREPGDAFPAGTALREAAEEVGLDPVGAGVRTVGELDVVDVRVSSFLLTPVLALAVRTPVFVPHPGEVAAILLPPVEIFLPGATVTMVEAERDGMHMRYGGYAWDGRHVWGATARVLAQLGALLAGRDPERARPASP
jgi:8-oxo-dGTP pyrophosphatase MutT (NUDIX family)